MDRTSIEPEELCFSVNDVIAVLDMTDDDWWQGMVDDKMGWFPASWVRVRDMHCCLICCTEISRCSELSCLMSDYVLVCNLFIS